MFDPWLNMAIGVVKWFNFKKDKSKTKQPGFIAQEVQKVIPEILELAKNSEAKI